VVLALVVPLVAACVTVEGGPDRLFTVEQEVTKAQELVEGLQKQYYALPPSDDIARMAIRNECIARRMYIIDVEYSVYEAALTSERQKFGFATATTSSGLSIASTLTTPVRSAQILSGVAAAIQSMRGFYDSEIVIAKTIQIAQGHMRAQRDTVAARQIFPRVSESAVTYPLSAALHDLEDYYRAGTLTAGLIVALRDSGDAAKTAAQEKVDAVAFGPDNATAVLRRYLMPSGKLDMARVRNVNSCLRMFQMPVNILEHLTRADSAPIRLRAIQCARSDPKFSG
jgi:hypothetical protein